MRSIAIITAALVCAATQLSAQSGAEPRTSENAVYLELLGNGGPFSINYDRRVGEDVAVRIGFASWTADDLFLGDEAKTELVTVPLTVSWLPGAPSRGIELGGGVLLGSRKQDEPFEDGSTSSTFVSLTGIVGYRWQPADGGWMFKIAFTPFFGLGDRDIAYPDRGFFPSAGASVGYSF